jgi:hypothetical protein
MLADQTELPIGELSAEASQRMVLDGYARHLLRVHHGAAARVTRIRHFMLSPMEKQNGFAPDDPRKYESLVETVQRSSDLTERQAPITGSNVQLGPQNPAAAVERSFR